MPPSKPACEVVAEYYNVKSEIIKKWKANRKASKSIKKFLEKLKYGIIDIADTIGADLLSAVASVASNVATTYLGTVSKMASAGFEYIFSLILQILLSAPTAIFSLVSIPHDAAQKATAREAILLGKAKKKVSLILHLILKWTSGRSGTNYYEQMKLSLPYINRAITLCEVLISRLEGDNGEAPGGSRNAIFDKSVYDKIRANINSAIEITEPKSVTEEKLGLNRRIQADKDERLRRKRRVINDEYSKNKLDISEKYRNEIAARRQEVETSDLDLKFGLNKVINTIDDTLGSDVLGFAKVENTGRKLRNIAKAQSLAEFEHIAKLKYEQRLDFLDLKRKEKLAIADSEAETEAVSNPENYKNLFSDTSSEFSSDMKRLGDCLIDLLRLIKDAYIENKKSQLHCNTIYDSRNIIKNIIKEVISFLRTSSNRVADSIISYVEAAQSGLEVVHDEFSEDVLKFEDPDYNISSSRMALTVVEGNTLLKLSETGLESTITDSMKDLINSDDVLQSANKEFDEFASRLYNIPDWDGRDGVWSVNIANSISLTPYIGLIANVTEAISKVPFLAFTGKEDNKRKVSRLIRNIDKSFRVLSRHNSIVEQVLLSYTPYSTSEAGDLKKFLQKSGLLDGFATGMSLTVLAADIATNFTDNVGDELPGYDNCKAEYEDLFEDDDLASAAVEKQSNLEDPRLGLESQEAREDNEEILAHNKLVRTLDLRSDDTLGQPGQNTVQGA